MTTAEELATLADDGNRYELIEGELQMMSPAGGRHGRIAVRLNKLLAIHVDDNGLGATFAAETGFRIAMDPDTVRAPDGAFVRQERMDALGDDSGFLPFAPDLAVEVVSPTDSFAAIERKAFAWLDAGTQLVLILEPETKTAHTYRSRNAIAVYAVGDTVDVSDVVRGWKFAVSEIFH
ncbi:MAG: Uma2 family endonuclease [Planctomycetaceae bacterium]